MISTRGFPAGAACAVTVAAALAVYLNALHNPFVYDDYRTVVGNASIEQLTNLRAIIWHDVTRPLVNLSYAIDFSLWGRNVVGYHATSLLLHAVNVGLLFAFVWRVTGGQGRTAAAMIAAGLLAVHPALTEAVGYVSGRSEVLCTTFFLLALLAGRRWIESGRGGGLIAMIGCWVASILTKETAAVFPFVFAAFDSLSSPAGDPRLRRRWRSVHLPLIVITVLAGVVRAAILWRVEYPGQIALRWSLVGMTLDVFRRYALLLIVPAGQAAFHAVPEVLHPWDLHVLEAVLLLVAVLFAVRVCRRRAWAISFGLWWFVVALIPSSLLVLMDRAEPMAEHRLYLAGCGLFLVAGVAGQRALTAATERLPRARWLVGAAAALVLAAFALDTIVRNVRWSDPVGLWSEAVERSPDHFWPRLLLGEALMQAGRPVDALGQFESAVQLAPSQPEPYAKVGICLISVGRPVEARAYFQEALARDPGSVSARQGLELLDSSAAPGRDR